MDPFTIGAIAAPIIGGLMGQEAAKGQQKSQERMYKEMLARMAGIDLPSVEDQKLNLLLQQSQGTYTPELEAALALGPSAMEQVAIDPRLRQQQMAALEQYAQVAQSGATPADEAMMEMVRRNAASEAQAKQGQILQEMQARGQGGSGAELIAKLQANESGADRLQQAQLQEAVAKQNARMAALAQQANLASGVRSQDYGQQTDLAKSRDVISQFNLQNQQNVGQRNVGSKNLAQQQNLQNAQAIANQNVALQNQQQMHNKGLLQQQFQNQITKATGQNQAGQNLASMYGNMAANTAGGMATIGQGVGSGFQTIATQNRQDDLLNKMFPVGQQQTKPAYNLSNDLQMPTGYLNK